MLTAARLPRAGELLTQYPHQLSGGMCQRVLIAIGVLEQSAPGHRRRADHRARCHHASADPDTDRRHAARARHRGHLHHPRPAACRATVRPGHRDVCRPRRRERAGARRAVDAGASLYALPAARQSIDACGAARALRHAGPDAEPAPAQKPVRLPFRAALSSCHRRVSPRRAAEHCHRRRSSCRVHSRRGDADHCGDGWRWRCGGCVRATVAPGRRIAKAL